MPVCYLTVISILRSLFASFHSDFWRHKMQSYLESAVSYDTFRLAGWKRVLSIVGAGFDGGRPAGYAAGGAVCRGSIARAAASMAAARPAARSSCRMASHRRICPAPAGKPSRTAAAAFSASAQRDASRR